MDEEQLKQLCRELHASIDKVRVTTSSKLNCSCNFLHNYFHRNTPLAGFFSLLNCNYITIIATGRTLSNSKTQIAIGYCNLNDKHGIHIHKVYIRSSTFAIMRNTPNAWELRWFSSMITTTEDCVLGRRAEIRC